MKHSFKSFSERNSPYISHSLQRPNLMDGFNETYGNLRPISNKQFAIL